MRPPNPRPGNPAFGRWCALLVRVGRERCICVELSDWQWGGGLAQVAQSLLQSFVASGMQAPPAY